MQGHDVRMVEPGGGLDFTQEALDPEARGELRMKHLDRDTPVELLIIAEENRGHTATTDLTRDRVAVRDCSLPLPHPPSGRPRGPPHPAPARRATRTCT